jgi:hypothetical protein
MVSSSLRVLISDHPHGHEHMPNHDRFAHAQGPPALTDNAGKNSRFREFYEAISQALWKEPQVSAWEDIQKLLEWLEAGESGGAGRNLRENQND